MTSRRLLAATAALALAAGLAPRPARADVLEAGLAKIAGGSPQQIAKLKSPDSNPTLETLEKVAHALGARLDVSLVPLAG